MTKAEEEGAKYYNESVREAIYRHRRADPERYNAYMRQYYQRKNADPVWRDNRLKKCREANARYREKQRAGQPAKARGRPRKIDPVAKYSED